ncbi:MAG: phosphonate ABC transporter, permease protein PhnE [Dehalococcoidia bacterium]|nr:MAG: phosphonate ABC transporter, permease protein PhnE [Dehalococcoidia bacterium]
MMPSTGPSTSAEVRTQRSRPPLPKPPERPWYQRWLWTLGLVGFVGLLLLVARNTDFNPAALWNGRARFWAIFSSLFQPDLTILPEVFTRALETLQISVLSVSLGAAVAFPVSFLAAKNIMAVGGAGSVVYYLCRTTINIVRSIPDLFWALVFVAAVGLGPFPGVLALTMFAFGMLGKLFSEAIEAIDPGPVEAVTATGASRTQVVVYAVLPQVIPAFIAHTLYAWEINVRIATVVGMVGAGGLGFLLRTYFSFFQYSSAATVILVTVVLVMAIDFASARIRARII